MSTLELTDATSEEAGLLRCTGSGCSSASGSGCNLGESAISGDGGYSGVLATSGDGGDSGVLATNGDGGSSESGVPATSGDGGACCASGGPAARSGGSASSGAVLETELGLLGRKAGVEGSTTDSTSDVGETTTVASSADASSAPWLGRSAGSGASSRMRRGSIGTALSLDALIRAICGGAIIRRVAAINGTFGLFGSETGLSTTGLLSTTGTGSSSGNVAGGEKDLVWLIEEPLVVQAVPGDMVSLDLSVFERSGKLALSGRGVVSTYTFPVSRSQCRPVKGIVLTVLTLSARAGRSGILVLFQQKPSGAIMLVGVLAVVRSLAIMPLVRDPVLGVAAPFTAERRLVSERMCSCRTAAPDLGSDLGRGRLFFLEPSDEGGEGNDVGGLMFGMAGSVDRVPAGWVSP